MQIANTLNKLTRYLTDNFSLRQICKPLFFNGEFGLRFNLQVGETDRDEYFEEVVRRAALLFEAAFDPTDTIFLLLRDYKWRRRKIRFSNYCFKQISDLSKTEISWSKIKNLYGNYGDIFNAAILKAEVRRINYRNIFTAIANTDFPPRKPRFKFMGSVEIYFINTAKNLIFHMYDDRGLDIIAADVESLRPIYTKFNTWILDANRRQIDEMILQSKKE